MAGTGGGGSLPPPRTPSYMAALLSASSLPSLAVETRASCTDSGEPACFFSKAEIAASLEAFRYAIVAKTSFGRPAYPAIKEHLRSRFDLKDDFTIAPLDSQHLLFRMRTNDDYLKILLRESTHVHGKLFRFFKWTMEFRVGEEPSTLPVWVELPGLPANFFHESMIRAIGGGLGNVLQVAFATQSVTNAISAKVCLELDVLQPKRERVWIGTGESSTSFWQPISYPMFPKFCVVCKRVGHEKNTCRSFNNDGIQPITRAGSVHGEEQVATGIHPPAPDDHRKSHEVWKIKTGARPSVATIAPIISRPSNPKSGETGPNSTLRKDYSSATAHGTPAASPPPTDMLPDGMASSSHLCPPTACEITVPVMAVTPQSAQEPVMPMPINTTSVLDEMQEPAIAGDATASSDEHVRICTIPISTEISPLSTVTPAPSTEPISMEPIAIKDSMVPAPSTVIPTPVLEEALLGNHPKQGDATQSSIEDMPRKEIDLPLTAKETDTHATPALSEDLLPASSHMPIITQDMIDGCQKILNNHLKRLQNQKTLELHGIITRPLIGRSQSNDSLDNNDDNNMANDMDDDHMYAESDFGSLDPLDEFCDDDFIPVRKRKLRSKISTASKHMGQRVSKSGRIIRQPVRF